MKSNSLLRSLFLILVSSSLIMQTSTGQSKTNRAVFRANLERTGVYARGGPKQLSELVWSFKTEGGVFSSPAISDGVVYFGSMDGRLYAVNIKTGQEKWSFKTENGIISSSAISDGVVYFGSDDGRLYATK